MDSEIVIRIPMWSFQMAISLVLVGVVAVYAIDTIRTIRR